MKHFLLSLLPAAILIAVILVLFTPCMNMVSESMNKICSTSSTASVPSFFNFESRQQEAERYTLSLAGNIFLIDVNAIIDTAKNINFKMIEVLRVSEQIGYLLY